MIDKVVHMCITAYLVWYRFVPIRLSTMSCYAGDGVYTFVLHILSLIILSSCLEVHRAAHLLS